MFRVANLLFMSDQSYSFNLPIAELIEQLSRSAYGEAFSEGLNPAQWAALRYFSNANRFSRSVGAFAQYHKTTRGTATQTIKALVSKGFLVRRPVKRDRRLVSIELTPKAKKLLNRDPFSNLQKAASTLSLGNQMVMAGGLQFMLNCILKQQSRPVFGVCGSCVHMRCEACEREKTLNECELFDQPLTNNDLNLICVNYEPNSKT